MRKIIIDTDACTDDAAAIAILLRDKSIKVEAITVVTKNGKVEEMAEYACKSIAMAKTYQPPVYLGSGKSLMGKYRLKPNPADYYKNVTMPQTEQKPESMFAVDAIFDLLEKNPGEIEIVTLGPLTNLAILCLKAPEILKKAKSITVMGGTGLYGVGNESPVAEDNIICDAEALDILLRQSEVPLKMIGFDVCGGECAFTESDLNVMEISSSPFAQFIINSSQWLLEKNMKHHGYRFLALADLVVTALVANPEYIQETFTTYGYVETAGPETYGQVLLYRMRYRDNPNPPINVEVVTKIDGAAVKKYLWENILA